MSGRGWQRAPVHDGFCGCTYSGPDDAASARASWRRAAYPGALRCRLILAAGRSATSAPTWRTPILPAASVAPVPLAKWNAICFHLRSSAVPFLPQHETAVPWSDLTAGGDCILPMIIPCQADVVLL